ncbi:MAG: aminotransferase class V-fold PLP-dependent enzyme [Natronomonas sp.]|uniref:aminotransferase class V-fold PLP-dependent enzyme n=1 Tax=Natronomonas sp. TaxID=2184060 RepID=UPI00286FB92D|nr:aminotransferase class V-fold PLP-dependent enzyme [Natronomonas sp.]MDR9431388.1 aminotransferase class V-fold PLP-dependent enzyme [Natronomonas sp.]
MTDDYLSVYDELDVPEVINAVGTKTRVGGTRVRPEAVDAMVSAAESFARISDLQARASEIIADATGAEAGYVTTGASAGLTLAAAACLAGHDLSTMARLPDTDGIADEIVVPKVHRNSYDHALRAAGATIVDVGTNDRTLGPVATDLETWELEAAITEETAAVGYVARNDLPLEPIVDVAHEHEVPVIVDAAGRLPPKSNLTAFVNAGADLVAFSGGKAVRGPQSTGFVAGRSDLVSAMALQQLDMDAVAATWDPPASLVDVDRLSGVPRHGIGRGFKVGKEEIVGFIRALESYVDEDERACLEAWDGRARCIGRALDEVTALEVAYRNEGDPTAVTRVALTVDEVKVGVTAVDLVRRLRQESPRVFVGDHDATAGILTVDPRSLTDDEVEYLVERLVEAMTD